MPSLFEQIIPRRKLLLIASETVIYSAIHIAKGAREAWVALPYGLLLYVIAADTGSVFYPFLSHLIVALLNDYRTLAVNPDMTVERRR